MHHKLLYPKQYLGAHDLKGKDATLTISALKHEELTMVGGIKEMKWVVYFAEMEGRQGTDAKRFVLNKKSHPEAIANLHGDDTDGWVGKKITLFPTKTRFGREGEVDCIRIRAPRHRQSKPA